MNTELTTTTSNPTQSLSVFSGEESFVAAQRMARALCASTLVPEMYRGESNLGNCLIALELANRTGASVLAVMQSMTPIHGKPSWDSKFLIATVNTCGRFSPLRFKFQGDPATDSYGCRAVAVDKSSGDELVGSLITIGMAKAEGWFGKNGSKWKTMPEQMLTYRAAAFWTRAYAPEVSLGMHTIDEVQDMVNVTPTPNLPKGLAPEKPNPALDVPVEVVADPREKLAGWLSSIGSTPEKFVAVAAREGWFAHGVHQLSDLTDEDIAWTRTKTSQIKDALAA